MKKSIFVRTTVDKKSFSFFAQVNFESLGDKIIYSIVALVFTSLFLGLIIFSYNFIEGNSRGLSFVLAVACFTFLWGMVKIGTAPKKEVETIDWEETLLSK